jgi:hypothetical protein
MVELSDLKLSADCQRLNAGVLPGKVEGKTKPPSKWHNVRTELRGMTFDSGHEAGVVNGLMLAEEQKAGVFGLRLQVRFPLDDGTVYEADAVYTDDKLVSHVVDAKGWDEKLQKHITTPEFKRKARLFREKYGKEIELL